MRAKPPVSSNVENNLDEKKSEFIEGANNKKEVMAELKKNDVSYPWGDDKVRDDLVKTFNIRLSEPDYLKLKYISDHTPESMHTFCLNAIIPAIEKQIKKITGK